MSTRAAFARVTAANFFFFLNFASFFLLPLHVRALGGSEPTIGLVMGVAGVAGLASLVAVGPLLDRVGRRPFLLGGMAAMGAMSAAFLFVDRIGPALFALRVVQGVAFAACFNAASTLAAELAPPARRASALGLFGVSTLTTHAIAPALGEVLVQHGGFRLLFAVATGFTVVGFAIAWSIDDPPAVARALGSRLRATRLLTSTIVTVGCCGAVFGTVVTYVPTFVHDAALGPVATFFLFYTGAAVLTRLASVRLGDTLARGTIIRPALALLAVSCCVLAAAHSPPVLAGAAMLFGTAQGFVYPTLNALAIDQSEPDQLGRTQTLYNGAFNLGATGGQVALGPVAEAVGYRAMFLCAAAVAALALLVFSVGTRADRWTAESSAEPRRRWRRPARLR